jgi:hypothetical protein
MALRQTAAEKKAAQDAQAPTADPEDGRPRFRPILGTEILAGRFPAAWGTENIEVFNSHNLTPKEDLLGVPFLIIGAELERTDGKDYDVVFVYALDIHGTEFEFNDASTGVREQVRKILINQGLSPTPNEGYQKLVKRIVIHHGLRNSDFKVTDKQSGKKVEASTWYLTGVSETH